MNYTMRTISVYSVGDIGTSSFYHVEMGGKVVIRLSKDGREQSVVVTGSGVKDLCVAGGNVTRVGCGSMFGDTDDYKTRVQVFFVTVGLLIAVILFLL